MRALRRSYLIKGIFLSIVFLCGNCVNKQEIEIRNFLIIAEQNTIEAIEELGEARSMDEVIENIESYTDKMQNFKIQITSFFERNPQLKNKLPQLRSKFQKEMGDYILATRNVGQLLEELKKKYGQNKKFMETMDIFYRIGRRINF